MLLPPGGEGRVGAPPMGPGQTDRNRTGKTISATSSFNAVTGIWVRLYWCRVAHRRVGVSAFLAYSVGAETGNKHPGVGRGSVKKVTSLTSERVREPRGGSIKFSNCRCFLESSQHHRKTGINCVSHVSRCVGWPINR